MDQKLFQEITKATFKVSSDIASVRRVSAYDFLNLSKKQTRGIGNVCQKPKHSFIYVATVCAAASYLLNTQEFGR